MNRARRRGARRRRRARARAHRLARSTWGRSTIVALVDRMISVEREWSYQLSYGLALSSLLPTVSRERMLAIMTEAFERELARALS